MGWRAAARTRGTGRGLALCPGDGVSVGVTVGGAASPLVQPQVQGRGPAGSRCPVRGWGGGGQLGSTNVRLWSPFQGRLHLHGSQLRGL